MSQGKDRIFVNYVSTIVIKVLIMIVLYLIMYILRKYTYIKNFILNEETKRHSIKVGRVTNNR